MPALAARRSARGTGPDVGRGQRLDGRISRGDPPAFPSVDVVALPRNVGFGAANNVALRQATAPLVLLLNSDTVVPAGAIDALVARLEATGAVAAGPRLVDAAGRPEVSFGSMLSPLTEWRQRLRVRLAARSAGWARRYVDRLVHQERIVDWVSGACLLVRRDAAAAAGLLRRALFPVRGGRGLLRRAPRRGRADPVHAAAAITHLRGRSGSSAGSAARLGRTTIAATWRSTRSTAPAGRPFSAPGCGSADDRSGRIRRELPPSAHCHRRAQAARLRHRHLRPQPGPGVGASGDRRHVRAALPARGPRVRPVTRPALRGPRRGLGQLLRARAVQHPARSLAARAGRSVPRAALRACRR